MIENYTEVNCVSLVTEMWFKQIFDHDVAKQGHDTSNVRWICVCVCCA